MKCYRYCTEENGKYAGFTMIELMVVMVILGIIAVVILSNFSSSIVKGRDAQRKSDLRHIAEALEMYANDVGKYPNDNIIGGEEGKTILGCGTTVTRIACEWGDQFKDDKATYLIKLPEDPSTGQAYYYEGSSTGLNYAIYTRLENTQDKDLSTSDGRVLTYDGTNCGGGAECNYGVSSANITPSTLHTLD
jgi:general secretion pathway protein G